MVHAESISFEECFEPTGAPIYSAPRGPFRLPKYQRDFAWSTDKIITLWKDMLQHAIENNQRNNASRKPFFLGTIVTENTNPINLVDGQQRFTALTIITSAIRDALITTGAIEKAWDLDSKLLNQYNNTTSAKVSRFTPFDKPAGHILSSERKLKPYRRRILDIDTGLQTSAIGNAGDTVLNLSGVCNWSAKVGTKIILKDTNNERKVYSISDRLRQADTPTTITITPALSTQISPDTDIHLKKQVKWPSTDLNDPATSHVYDKELRNAYKKIRSNVEHFILQSKTYINPKLIKYDTTRSGATAVAKPKSTHVKPNEDMNQNQQLLDIGGDLGKVGDTVQFIDSTGTTHNFILKKDISIGSKGDRLQLRGHNTAANDIPLSSEVEIGYGGTPTNGWLTTPSHRQDNFFKLIKNLKFARLHFSSSSDALNFFTTTNDSSRMSPLTIFDLLLAFTESVSAPAAAAGYNISVEWEKIRKNIYTDYGNDVNTAVDFFYQWMMASKRWNGNKRWESAETWVGLRTELEKYHFDKYSGWDYAGLLEVYKEIVRYSKIYTEAKKPEDITVPAARRNEKVYLHILNQGNHKQHLPTYMAISDRFNVHHPGFRDAVIEEHLKNWLYVYLRYNLFPNNCTSIETIGYESKKVYSKVVGGDSWVNNIHKWVISGTAPTTVERDSIKKMPKDLEPANKSPWPWVANHAKYKQMNGNRVLVYAYERALNGTGNKACAELFGEIQVEHILPQKPSNWGTKWYDAATKKPKQIHAECVQMLGNMILLEDTINSHCSNLPFKEKVKGGEVACTVSSHIEDSNTKTAKEITDYYNGEKLASPRKNVKWNKTTITENSKKMMNVIVGFFS